MNNSTGNSWPQCRDCKFWSAEATGDEAMKIQGECHKHSPKPLYITEKKFEVGEWMTVFPLTWGDDWCGEFVKFTGEW